LRVPIALAPILGLRGLRRGDGGGRFLLRGAKQQEEAEVARGRGLRRAGAVELAAGVNRQGELRFGEGARERLAGRSVEFGEEERHGFPASPSTCSTFFLVSRSSFDEPRCPMCKLPNPIAPRYWGLASVRYDGREIITIFPPDLLALSKRSCETAGGIFLKQGGTVSKVWMGGAFGWF
jgi:hypothetical protein